MLRGGALSRGGGHGLMRRGGGPRLRKTPPPLPRRPRLPPPTRRRIKFRTNIFLNINIPESSNDNDSDEPPTEEELRRAFDKVDSDKDGKISRDEFKEALRALDPEIADSEIAKAFQALDSDRDGFVDFREFMQLFDVGPAEAKDSAGVDPLDMIPNLPGGGGFIGSGVELFQVLRRLGMG